VETPPPPRMKTTLSPSASHAAFWADAV